jgi:hypothetical protein
MNQISKLIIHKSLFTVKYFSIQGSKIEFKKKNYLNSSEGENQVSIKFDFKIQTQRLKKKILEYFKIQN